MGKVLLTGATGQVGHCLARRLAATGLHVVGVGRRVDVLHTLAEELGRNFFVPLTGDLTRGDFIQTLAEHGPFDVLVHTAAATATNCNLRKLYAHNAAATARLLEGLKGRVGHVVYFSTIDVYGLPQSCPVTEDYATRPATFYGASKLAGEEYVRLFAADQNIPAVSLRVSCIYGSGGKLNGAMSVFLRNALGGRPLHLMGDGSELRDYIHVEDVADGACRAIEQRLDSVFNLGGGMPISIQGLALLARELTQSPAGIEFTPRTRPQYDLFLDIRKLGRATGFAPRTDLREGMARELVLLRAEQAVRPPRQKNQLEVGEGSVGDY